MKLEVKCRCHPKYTAKRRPTRGCVTCGWLYSLVNDRAWVRDLTVTRVA